MGYNALEGEGLKGWRRMELLVHQLACQHGAPQRLLLDCSNRTDIRRQAVMLLHPQ